MIEWGNYTIKQDENTKEFIVFDEFNCTQHRFDTIDQCGDFIKKELIYVHKINKD